jgi:hypothetical protein
MISQNAIFDKMVFDDAIFDNTIIQLPTTSGMMPGGKLPKRGPYYARIAGAHTAKTARSHFAEES